MCGYRYSNGSCKVKVDKNTGEEGIKAGKELENKLNEIDEKVKNIDNKAIIPVVNDNGDHLGDIAGKDFKKAWNKQKFRISKKDPKNGGLGSTIPGKTTLLPSAVEKYADGAVGRGGTRSEGVGTLIGHEFGHALDPGLAISKANPVTGKHYNKVAEKAASAQGNSIFQHIQERFICSLPGTGC